MPARTRHEAKESSSMKIQWGTGLVIVFGLFVAAVLAVVAFAMTRRVELVTDGYYEKGLAYQRQIDRIDRTRKEGVEVGVEVVPEGVLLRFPRSSAETAGDVLAYRPDDRSLDFTLPVGVDAEGRMLIPRGKLASGAWRVQITWARLGEEYYHEVRVTIP
jgi:hypothetical protein